MTKRAAICAAVLWAAPVAAQSLDLDGVHRWLGSDPATACDTSVYNDGQMTIDGATVAFIETSCKLGDPVAIRDMPEGTLYDAVCNGEGDIWTERMLVYKTFDGIAILSRGAVRTYQRCE